MTVEVVRRDVDLMRLRESGNFQRLPHSVPHAIDDRHVEGASGKVWQELCATDQRLAPSDAVSRCGPGSGQLSRAVAVDLNPVDVEVMNRREDLSEPSGRES